MIGRTFSHYRIEEKIGGGGMGEVYRATDTKLGREVAIKALSPRLIQDRAAVARFMREARAVSALNHPNIVTVHEIGEEPDGYFIVMEFIRGRTLRALAAERPSLAELARIGAQAARALSVAHEAGIVHRDIKPENLMLRHDGYLKVLDFGLARLAPAGSGHSAAETATQTTPGTLLGTPQYMSPEQLRGEAVTCATDVFSLGIVLYELATRLHPFAADSQVGLLHGITSRAPLPPSRLNPEISKPLEALILHMLEKDPRLRPSAVEVERALSGWTGKEAAVVPGTAAVRPPRRTVGREKEREELLAAYQSARDGRGLLLCVGGEAGIGKTTLVEEFLGDLKASEERCSVARGRCSERLAGAEAYLPFVEALESLVQGEDGASVSPILKVLAPLWFGEITPQASGDRSTDRLAGGAQAASLERMKRELSAFFQEISRIRPLVVFFDDLHWADVSTVDLLAYLGPRLEAMRVLVVVTYRTEELLKANHPFVPIKLDLQGRGICREISLGFLTPDDVEDYLALEFPQNRFPRSLPEIIHAKTEGSPLFMTDLVRDLCARKVIVEEDGHWSLAHSVPDIERELPASVRSMIQRKIERVDEEDRRLLVAASVQGYECDSALLARALATDAAQVEDRLERLDRIHAFLQAIGETEFPDGTLTVRYRFVHVLYQNALYASLKPARRASLSASVAGALLAHYGDSSDDVASDLAFLFEAARDFERAADYFRVAAQNAARVFAPQEAVVLARRGLEMFKRLPDSPRRVQRELSLLLILGGSLGHSEGWGAEEAEQAFIRARELCQHAGGAPDLFRVLWGLWVFYIQKGKSKQTRELAAECSKFAQRTQDPAIVMSADALMGITLAWFGDPLEGRTYLERAFAQYLRMGDFSLGSEPVPFHPGWGSLGDLGIILWVLGYFDLALKKIDEARELAKKLSDRLCLCLSLNWSAWIRQFRREPAQAQEPAEAAIQACADYGNAQLLAMAYFLRGWSLAEQANLAGEQVREERGIAEMRKGLDDLRASGAELFRPQFIALLAEALARTGQAEEGLAVIGTALREAEEQGATLVDAELHRVKGELLLMQAVPAGQEAEACFHQALAIARRKEAKAWELRATMSLGRLWARQGKKERAREALEGIYGWFTEGFDTLDLKEAKALLEGLS